MGIAVHLGGEKQPAAPAIGVAGRAVLTVPVVIAGTGVAAFVFERDTPFAPEDITRIEGLVTLLGPVLNEKRLNDRWLGAKALDAAARQVLRRRPQVRERQGR